jgi:hypothetical protein
MQHFLDVDTFFQVIHFDPLFPVSCPRSKYGSTRRMIDDQEQLNNVSSTVWEFTAITTHKEARLSLGRRELVE